MILDLSTLSEIWGPLLYVDGSTYGRGAIFYTIDGVSVMGHTGFHRGHITRAFYSPEHDTSVIITETFESITSNIAKELIKSTRLFKAANAEDKKLLLANDRQVAADIRDAYREGGSYTEGGQYNREQMVQEYGRYREGIEGTRFDTVMGKLNERQQATIQARTSATISTTRASSVMTQL